MKRSKIYLVAILALGVAIQPLDVQASKVHNTAVSHHTKIAIKKTPLVSSGGNFSVPAGYGWLKVWIRNSGHTTLTVNVRMATTNKPYLSYEVPAGKQLIIPNYGKATGIGLHVINFSSKDGVLSGSYSIRMADSPSASK